jgi:hypothetical protein
MERISCTEWLARRTGGSGRVTECARSGQDGAALTPQSRNYHTNGEPVRVASFHHELPAQHAHLAGELILSWLLRWQIHGDNLASRELRALAEVANTTISEQAAASSRRKSRRTGLPCCTTMTSGVQPPFASTIASWCPLEVTAARVPLLRGPQKNQAIPTMRAIRPG